MGLMLIAVTIVCGGTESVSTPAPNVADIPAKSESNLKSEPSATTVDVRTDTPVPTPEPTLASSTDFHTDSIDESPRELVPQSLYSGAGWDPLSASERYLANLPPDKNLISTDFDDSTGIANVTGEHGSVPSNSIVVVANLELGVVKIVQADSKGAFTVQISAQPGTNILIKQDAMGIHGFGSSDAIVEGETILNSGIIITVPIHKSDNGYPFAGAARTSGGPVWLLNGNLSRISYTPGDAVHIEGNVHLLTESPIPEGLSLTLSGQMIGDHTGIQVSTHGRFVSRLLTRTGLPIEINTHQDYPIFGDCSIENLVFQATGFEQVEHFSCTAVMKDGVPSGTYVMWLTLNVPEQHEQYMAEIQEQKLLKSVSQFSTNSVQLATVTVGSPKPLRIASTLFADLLQEGTRGGIISRQDTESFAISPRIITQHNPVIPRLDSHGNPWIHQLEPYAILLGITDRSPPSSPLIAFDFSASELRVTVERPDGQIDSIGPAPIISYGVHTPSTPFGGQIAGGGNHIGEIPQFMGAKGEFSYSFPLDGDYVIRHKGHVSDTNGQRFEISGTYDLTVGNSLDIETALLPGTPFEIGDSLPISLNIVPGLPADINFKVTHVGESDTIHEEEYTGTANENGWWDGDGQYFIFEKHGEYRIDVEARYIGKDDTLWVGRMTFGSAIATSESPIIAHGRRGHDRVETIQPPWGFGADLPSDGHLQFPFFTGDILWGSDGEVNRLDGTVGAGPGDSVNTVFSFQAVDATHPLVIRAMESAKQRYPNYAELEQAGQIPLVTQIEENDDNVQEFKGVNPEDYKVLTYAYGSAQRPSVRVREVIQAEDTSAYWRFNDAYHLQSGNSYEDGDLPGEFKFLYGATVIRDIEEKTGVFSIYGSGWIHASNEDPQGSRFMPPFQGNAGGPNGGPLFNIHGRDIDIFFLPMGVRPGSVLEVGDIFRMAGPVMPTLPSRVEYRVIAPDGTSRDFNGRANAIGYFYDPAGDFELDQAGIWTVELVVTHDGMTSAGPVQQPYPAGGPLTPDGLSFSFVVIDNSTRPLAIATNLAKVNPQNWYRGVTHGDFEALLPENWEGDVGRVIATIPGIVLVDEELSITQGLLKWEFFGDKMNKLVQNFDYLRGIADTITLTYFAQDLSGKQVSGTIATHGARVPLAPLVPPMSQRSDRPTGQTTCIAGETELFSSDFENGTEGWRFSDDNAWSVVQADGSNALRGIGHAHASGVDNWDEVIWRMRVKLISGGTHINFHVGNNGQRYSVSFWEESTSLTGGESDVSYVASHPLEQWNVVEIGILNDVLFIGSNGLLEIRQIQSNPLPSGGIDFEVLDDSEVLFDDVVICKPR